MTPGEAKLLNGLLAAVGATIAFSAICKARRILIKMAWSAG